MAVSTARLIVGVKYYKIATGLLNKYAPIFFVRAIINHSFVLDS